MAMAEDDQIRQILTWIGFVNIQEREAIIIDAFESYNYLLALNDKDITSLIESFGRRTVQNGRFFWQPQDQKVTISIVLGTGFLQDFHDA